MMPNPKQPTNDELAAAELGLKEQFIRKRLQLQKEAILDDLKIKVTERTRKDVEKAHPYWEEVRKNGKNGFEMPGYNDWQAALILLCNQYQHIARAMFYDSPIPPEIRDAVTLGFASQILDKAFPLLEKVSALLPSDWEVNLPKLKYDLKINKEGTLVSSLLADSQPITSSQKTLYDSAVDDWLNSLDYSANEQGVYHHKQDEDKPLSNDKLQKLLLDSEKGFGAYMKKVMKLSVERFAPNDSYYAAPGLGKGLKP